MKHILCGRTIYKGHKQCVVRMGGLGTEVQKDFSCELLL